MKSRARLDLLAHELGEHVVRLGGVVDVHPQQRARGGVHRRLPELVGVHLAEALEALDGEVLDLHLLDDAVALLLVGGVAGDLAGAHAVERRLGDVEVAGLDEVAACCGRRRSSAASGCGRRRRPRPPAG